MGVSKAYRIQIYPSRAVHLLLKELAQESGQTISKTAVSLIEQALNSDSVLSEVRIVKQEQVDIYQRLVELISINAATVEYMLKKSYTPEEMVEARQAISNGAKAIREHFSGGNENAGN